MQKLYAVLVCLLLHTALCAQTIYRVSTTGNDNNNGLTWSAPFRTMQKALATASGNAQIWVARGTYFPDEGPGVTANDRTAAFVMKNGVAIYGGFAGTETVLSGRNWKTNPTILSGDIDQNDGPAFANNANNSYQVLRNYDNNLGSTAIIDGFTVTGGNANGTFSENQLGGGMFNAGSSPLILNCAFRANAGSNGGAVANVSSSPSFISCTFSANKAASYGGASYNGNNAVPKFISCAIWANTAVTGGGAIFNQTAASTVTNCSFSGNAAPNSGGLFDFNSNSTIRASIFWGNGVEISTQGGATTVSKSIVKGGYAGTGNLTQDPLFLDSAGGDLRILPCSPAVDAGDDAVAVTNDAGGNPRKFDAFPGGILIDIGAYEYQASVSASILYVNALAPAGGHGQSWSSAMRTLQEALRVAADCPLISQIWVAKGTYYPDEGPGLKNNDRTRSFHLQNGVAIYGGFTGSETLLSQRNWRANPTILSGDIDQNDGTNFQNHAGNSQHVVVASGVGNTAIIDGFNVTSGHASSVVARLQPTTDKLPAAKSDFAGGGLGGGYSGNTPPSPYVVEGGGMININADPIIANCTFSLNMALLGGGMYNRQSEPTITGCSFLNNKTDRYGSAIDHAQTNLKLKDCIFAGNSTLTGTIYTTDSYTLINCLFALNQVNSGSAVYGSASGNRIVNCSFFGNSSLNGNGVLQNSPAYPSNTQSIHNSIFWANQSGGVVQGGQSNITYSNVQDGIPAGAANISQDPLFANSADPDGADNIWGTADDGLRLQCSSPSVNTGRNDSLPAGTITDLVGAPRIQLGQVDMGAYETAGATDKKFYVTQAGAGNKDGASWPNATPNLQWAIDRAGCLADSVFVARGAYQPAAGQSFVLREGVKLYGHFAGTENTLKERRLTTTDTTVLRGNGSSVINNDNNGLTTATLLDGFVITGGSGTQGGGMRNISASPTVQNCHFIGNTATEGGAIYANLSNPVINNCLFANNSSATGAAIRGVFSNYIITNSTLAGNTGSNAIVTANGSLTLQNSIVWGNAGGITAGGLGTRTYSYNNVQGGVLTGTANISQDPLFPNAATPAGPDGIFGTVDDGLRLGCGSPSKNTGSNALVSAGTITDILGFARIRNTTVDMGAYEAASNGGGAKFFVTNSGSGLKDGTSWANAFGDIQTAINVSCASDSVFVKGGIYQMAFKQYIAMKDGVKIYGHFAGTESSLSQRNLRSADTSFLQGIYIYESSESEGAAVVYNYNNGVTRSAVLDGFTIRNGFGIFGGGIVNFGTSPTVRNCVIEKNTGYGFSTAILQHGESASGPALYEDCIIRNNVATDEAVGEPPAFLIHNASPVINRFVFDNNLNANRHGEAINASLNSHALITNSIIVNHKQPIICGYSEMTFVNCTFAKNVLVAEQSDDRAQPIVARTTFNNCVLWGNSKIFDGLDSSGGGNSNLPHLNYSIAPDFSTYPGVGNTNADPLYVNINDPDGPDNIWGTADDGLRLQCGSPAINAGRNDSLPAGTTLDVAGAPRIQQGQVDIGAYENLPQLTTYTFTGSGNWSVVSNWQGGMKPPSPLPPCSEVVINPTTGNCVLDTPFVVPPPGKITIKQGKNLIIPGNLLLQ